MPRVILVIFVLIFLPGCARMGPLSPLAPLERSFVFPASPYPEGDWQPPGLAFEDAWFEATDGAQLHGWFLPHVRPRAVVLFLHGNAGNISSRAGLLTSLHDRHGLAVMAFDYRGYGRSEGKPHEQGVLKDARAARAWLARRTGVAEQDIVLIGRSLGGGVAVDLAAHDGARGLVLASTFTSLPDVATHHMPWLPAKWLMSNRLDSLAKIEQYDGPLLQYHGQADQVVPFDLGEQLFANAPGPKRFVAVADTGHNDPWPEDFHQALDDFFASIAMPGHAGQALAR